MTWNADSMRALVASLRAHRGDFTDVEVKRGTGGVPNLAETLCAFGNLPSGGTIVVGLNEAAGFEIVGVTDPAATAQAITSQARSAIDPPLNVTFDTVSLDEKTIVVVTVAGVLTSQRPCRTGGRVYLRQADGDYLASAAEEQQMLATRDRPRFDAATVPATSIADLDQRLLNELVDSVRRTSRRLADLDEVTVLRRKGIVAHDSDELTIAGLYALGEYPQQFAPSLSVTAAVVTAPGSPNRLINLAHFDGPIPDLLAASLEWLQRNIHTGVQVLPDGNNVNRSEFPAAALRELVANAIVHRDLSPHTQSKQVEIRLLPDRLVISSPGGLWGVSREQLGAFGAKSAVNEYMYEICRNLSTSGGYRVIEGEGGGIREAERELNDWKVDPPIFVDRGVTFAVVLMRPNMSLTAETTQDGVAVPLGAPQSRIMNVLQAGEADRSDLVSQTGLTRSQVRYALEKLIKQNKVVMRGGWGDRTTRYAISDERE